MVNEKEVTRFVKPFYAKRDPMHNFSHIIRIKRKIAFLRKQYKNIDDTFLNFLIYFHGSRKWARKNKDYIVNLGYPASWINKINKPTSVEGKLVWDANMLENVGKFGIKKNLECEKYYQQTRKETLKIVKRYSKDYRFYTPLGKKLGNPGIKIKNEWLKKQLANLKV